MSINLHFFENINILANNLISFGTYKIFCNGIIYSIHNIYTLINNNTLHSLFVCYIYNNNEYI